MVPLEILLLLALVAIIVLGVLTTVRVLASGNVAAYNNNSVSRRGQRWSEPAIFTGVASEFREWVFSVELAMRSMRIDQSRNKCVGV